MYKARNYINKKALLGLYHSYIYHYLIYCIESCGNASNCHIDPLSMLQKCILRILTISNYDVFYKEEFLLRKFSKKTIYIYNIVITVELQMGHTLYIIQIIVSIMNH